VTEDLITMRNIIYCSQPKQTNTLFARI